MSIFLLALPYASVKFSCTHAPPPRLTPRHCFVVLGWEILGEATLKQSNYVPFGDDKRWRVNAPTLVSPQSTQCTVAALIHCTVD